jgi:CheY-like chemotaxis protein
MVVGSMLRQLKCQYDFANNGLEACQRYPQGDYFLVLMDLLMPVMDGFEATARIVASPEFSIRQTQIVALTASVMEAELAQARRAGCVRCLSKPVKMHDLRETVMTAALQHSVRHASKRIDSSKTLTALMGTCAYPEVLNSQRLNE